MLIMPKRIPEETKQCSSGRPDQLPLLERPSQTSFAGTLGAHGEHNRDLVDRSGKPQLGRTRTGSPVNVG